MSNKGQYFSAPLQLPWRDYEFTDTFVNSFFEDPIERDLDLLKNENNTSNTKNHKFSTVALKSESNKANGLPDSKKTALSPNVQNKLINLVPHNVGETIVDQFMENYCKMLKMSPPHDRFEEKGGGKFKFKKKLWNFILKDAPIRMILPAFPCKSPNSTDKVLGTLPDRGEELALEKLNSFCKLVKQFYQPGCVVTIFSDGRVFSDLVGVNDSLVDQYNKELKRMIVDIDPDNHIIWDTLDNYMDHIGDPDGTRQELLRRFGQPMEVMEHEIDTVPETCNVYRAFIKFLSIDRTWPADYSKTQIKKECSFIAKEMMRRNNAFSKIVEVKYPDDIRLSIHAHPNTGPKFGVSLVDVDMSKPATPWHNVVVELKNGSNLLMHKSEVQKLKGKFELVEKYGRPWYYKEVPSD